MSLVFRNLRLRLGDMALELDATLSKKVTALFGTSGSGKTSARIDGGSETARTRRNRVGRRYPNEYLATGPPSREGAGHRLRSAGPRALSASYLASKHRLRCERPAFSPPGNLPRETLPRLGYRTLVWPNAGFSFRRGKTACGGSRERSWRLRSSFCSMNLWRVSTDR